MNPSEPLPVARGPILGYRKGSQLISCAYLSTGWVCTKERIPGTALPSLYTPNRLKEQAIEWARACEQPAKLPPSRDRISIMWMFPATSNLTERQASPQRFRSGLEEILRVWDHSLANSSEETGPLYAVTPAGVALVPNTLRKGGSRRSFDPKAEWIDELAKALEPMLPAPKVEVDF